MQISYLCSMEQALNYLSNQGLNAASNVDYENNIKLYRLAAHDKICKYLGFEIVDTTYTDEVYSSDGNKVLYLDNRPVTALDAVKINDVAVDKTAYIVMFGNHLYNENYFTKGTYNYKISYKAGWTQASMPADMRLAALQLIALYNGQNGGAGTTIGKASVSNGQGNSESIDPEAENKILSSLSRYVRHDRF